MIPETLYLENFGAHAQTTIQFGELQHAAVLTGPTAGSGKSTVIDAILYVLTGRGRAKKDIDAQVRRGRPHAGAIHLQRRRHPLQGGAGPVQPLKGLDGARGPDLEWRRAGHRRSKATWRRGGLDSSSSSTVTTNS